MKKIRVELPSSLCSLADITHGIDLLVAESITPRAILDTLERELPMLQGTLHDPCPEAVVSGDEPFLIIGAIADG